MARLSALLGVIAISALMWSPAAAQGDPATVSLTKSATTTSAAPGTPFTYDLAYSCSSLDTTCDGVEITDVLAAPLSLTAATVTPVGDSNTVSTNYDPATGTATWVLTNPLPAGSGVVSLEVEFAPGTTPVGASFTNTAQISADNAATATSNPVTVDATVTPGISLTKGPTGNIVAGVPFTYTGTLTNSGQVILNNTTVTDALTPLGLTCAVVTDISAPGTCDTATNAVIWNYNPLAFPFTTTWAFTVTYPASSEGASITNTIDASGTAPGMTTATTASASVTNPIVTPAPAVTVTKLANPTPSVPLGQPVQYQMAIENSGNVPLDSVTMTDTLPAGATFASCTVSLGSGAVGTPPTPTCTDNGDTVTFDFPDATLAVDGIFTGTIVVSYETPPFTAGQVVTNNVTGSAVFTPSGQTVTGSASVDTTLTGAGVGSVTKTLTTPAAFFAVDNPATYAVGVANSGATPWDSVVVTDQLPVSPTTGAFPTAVSCTPTDSCTYDPTTNTVTWTFGSLAPGASVTPTPTVTLTYQSPDFQPQEVITNCASAVAMVAGAPIDVPQECDTHTLAASIPGANITKTNTGGTAATVVIGNRTTWDMTYTNSGTAPLTNFTMTDTLPPQLTPSPGGNGPGGNFSFADPRGVEFGAADLVQWHDPTTGAWTTLPLTLSTNGTLFTGRGIYTASIPAGADMVRIIYTGTIFPGFTTADIAGTSYPTQLIMTAPATALGRTGAEILNGAVAQNCAQITADQLTAEQSPSSCANVTITEPVPTTTLTKSLTSPSPVPPPSAANWSITYGAQPTSPAPILNPTVTDCLPVGLDLVDPADPGDPANGSPPANFGVMPSISRVVGAAPCAANQVAIIWSWAGDDPALSIPAGTTGVFTLNTMIQAGTAPQTLTNTVSAIADNAPTRTPNATAPVVVVNGASLNPVKEVKGSLDPDFAPFPAVGQTTLDGSADYRLSITNTGNIPLENITALDILPFPGDTSVLSPFGARDSQWQPVMTAPVSAPAGVTVLYSTSNNPCLPDDFAAAGGAGAIARPGCSGTFSTTPPDPISSVASLEFEIAGPLAGGDTVQIEWPMIAPATVVPGQVAYNSFAVVATRTDTGDPLAPAAEPNKVGMEIQPYPLQIDKEVNGELEPNAPGLQVPVGAPVTYTYLVSNPGDLEVTNLDLVDSPAQTITCTLPDGTTVPAAQATIAAHSTLTCTADAGAATTGLHTDTATVTGAPVVDGTPGTPTDPVSATANYTGFTPSVALSVTKTSSPKPYLAGQTLTYTVTVSNAGPDTATGATVSDPLPAPLAGFTWTCVPAASPAGSTCSPTGTGDIDDTVTIVPGGSVTYTLTGTVPPGTTATITNTVTVTPPPLTSDPACLPTEGSPCVATDTNSPATVALSVTKTSTPNPHTAGEPLTYTITVNNAGPDTATGAAVDDPLPAALAGFTWTCSAATSPAGSSCTASGSGDIHDTVTIVSGGSVTYTVTGTVPADSTGTLTNTVTVTPPPGTLDTECVPTAPSPCVATDQNAQIGDSLSVGKTSAPKPYTAGQTLTYTITVRNAGPDTAAGATVSDPLPAALAGFTWTCAPAATPAGSSCTAAGTGDIDDTVTIVSGGSVVYTVTGTVPAGTTGTLTNTVTVTPPPGTDDPECVPTAPSPCVATDTNSQAAVALSVTKTSSPKPYLAGQTLTYTVMVDNAGPEPATGAMVSDPLPAALQGAGFTWTCSATTDSTCGSGAATGSGNAPLTDTPTVAAHGTITYTITGTVPAGTTGDLENTVTVTPPPGVSDPECTLTRVGTPCVATDVNTQSGVNLAVTKTSAPKPYTAGQALTYTVTVTNAGPDTATGATVSDPLPAALAGFTWTCAPAATPAGSSCTATGTGDIADTVTIVSGGSVTYTVTGTVPAGTTGTLTNTVTVTPPPGASDPACTDTVGSPCVATDENAQTAVALSVTKTSTPNPYIAGQPLTYTVTVSNAGPDTATGATVSDPLPAALAGFTWTCTPAASPAGSSCTASGAGDIDDTVTIVSGGSVIYTVTGTLPAGTTGTLTNTVTVTPPPGTMDTECVPAAPSPCVATDTNSQAAVALSVTKTSSPKPYLAGQTLTYTVTVSNAGPQPATGATVSDPLPAALQGAGFAWTCTATADSACGSGAATGSGSAPLTDMPTVAAGGTITYTITGTVPAGTTGELDNTVTVTPPPGVSDTACVPTAPSPCVATDTNAQTGVDLAVTKTSTPNPYTAGQALTYTITVTNAGPDTATGAAVDDPLPAALAGFTWTCSATGPAGSSCTASGAGDIHDTVTLVAGGTLTYTVTGTVPAGTTATLRNTVTVTPPPGASDPTCTPTAPSPCVATDTNAQTGEALSVTKTSSPKPYIAGEPLTYTITVSNAGPDTATGAVVDDTLPAALAGFAWTCAPTPPGASSCAATGSGNVHDTPTIAAGGSVTYTVMGTVPLGTTGTLTNTVVVTPPPGSSDADCTQTAPSPCVATDTNPQAAVALSVTKTSQPNPYTAGQPLTYTITVSNAGPQTATGAAVDDPLPAALSGSLLDWTCAPAATPAGNICSAFGAGDIHDTVTIVPGGSVTYTVSGTVAPGTTGIIRNTVTVTAPPGVSDPACVQTAPSPCVATDTNSQSGESLSVVKSADPAPYLPGQPLTYTVVVSNAGPDPAVAASVSDPLPAPLQGAGFTWTCSSTAGSSCRAATGVGNVTDTPNLAAGGSVTYVVTGTVPVATTGPLTNTVTVTPPAGTSDVDCVPTAPSPCVATNIDDQAAVALSITKSSAPNPFTAGQTLTYTVTVSNAGPGAAAGATVDDTLPAPLAGFTWSCTASAGSTCTASGSGDIHDTVTVLAGGTLTYTLTGTLPLGTTGQIANTATITPPAGVSDPACDPTSPPNPCSATDTNQQAVVALSITKTSTPNPYTAGQTLTYTIAVSNAGPDPAAGAAVADGLPAELTGFTWTCSATTDSTCGSGTATGSGTAPLADTPTIAAHGTVTYTITGTVPAGLTDELINRATVAPPAGVSDPQCDPASTTDNPCVAVNDNPQITTALSVTKTSSPNPYLAGQALTYTVTVQNAGPDPAAGVTVADPMPSALAGAGFTWTCTASSASACGAASGNAPLQDTPTIEPEGTVTYLVSGTVPAGTTGTLTNTATVTPALGTTDTGCSPDCSATTHTLQTTTGLSVTKTSSPNPYTAGQALTYTIRVSNAGPDTAVDAAVSDPMPAALRAAGFTWTCAPSGPQSSCGAPSGNAPLQDMPTIAPGDSVTYEVTGTVPAATTGMLANTVSVSSPAGAADPNCDACTASNMNPQAPQPDSPDAPPIVIPGLPDTGGPWGGGGPLGPALLLTALSLAGGCVVWLRRRKPKHRRS